ncbi:potassium channel family protein [Hoeflea sp.]|uniref:potassium channel family protein n=1 Tax=Hoeflea sp. TaxID=1940281 RepID=UPI003B516C5D
MIVELAIGTATIIASMAIMIAFMLATLRLVRKAEDNYADHRPALWQFFVLLSGTVTLVLLAHTICVWLWALLFRVLGVFHTVEEAVYFSLVSFTTVGYGDVVVDPGWRILSGFVAVNGLLAFGIFTAVLIEVIRSLSKRYMPRG